MNFWVWLTTQKLLLIYPTKNQNCRQLNGNTSNRYNGLRLGQKRLLAVTLLTFSLHEYDAKWKLQAKFVGEDILSCHKVQKRTFCFLISLESRLTVSGPNLRPNFNQHFLSKRSCNSNITFLQLCPSELRMAS